MLRDEEEGIDRWIRRAMGQSTSGLVSDFSRGLLFERDRRLYSFSSELGRPIGERGEVRLWLLNGDEAGPSTRQQTMVRERVQRTGVPVLVIPFSVLDAAGVDRDSVELVEDQPERFTVSEHRSPALPGGVQEFPAAPDGWVPLTEQEIAKKLRRMNHRRLMSIDSGGGAPPTREITRADLAARLHGLEKYANALSMLQTREGDVIRVGQYRDGGDVYLWTARRHWLGESLIRANATGRAHCATCHGSGRVDRARTLIRWTTSAPCADCHGSGTGPVRRRQSYYLSGFDHQEPRPLYFFCELPQGASPTTVVEAYESLKPEPVRLGEQMGRTVHRQGDIFAVAAPSLTTRELRQSGATFKRKEYVLGTNHRASEVAVLPNGVTLARGTLTHTPPGRPPDHVPRTMTPSDAWHVVLKNTVPVEGR